MTSTSSQQAAANLVALSSTDYSALAAPRPVAARPRSARVEPGTRKPDFMATFVGQVASASGLSRQHDELGRHVSFRLPGRAFKREQPFHLPVRIGHLADTDVGVIDHLEIVGGALIGVGRIVYSAVLDDRWHLSADSTVKHGETVFNLTDARMTEVSLVRRSADIGNNYVPVFWVPVDLARDRGCQPFGMPTLWRPVWDRAAEIMASRRYRRAPQSLVIVGADPPVLAPAPVPARAGAASTQHKRAVEAVRLDGQWLDAAHSARLLDLFEGIG